MKKKYAFIFLGLLLLTIFMFNIFSKENKDSIKTDSSKLEIVIRKGNIVDEELIEFLTSFNGKFSLFEERTSIKSTTIAQNKDINVKVNSRKNSFPKDTKMEVKSIEVDEKKVIDSLKEYSKNMKLNGVYAVDITFKVDGKEQQPKENVLLTIELPEDLDYSKSNTLVLLHFDDNDNIEVVGTKPIKSIYDKKYVSFVVSSFSPYAVALVDAQYPATLMRDELADSEDYEIVTFKTDLFKYDPILFNDAGSGDRFMFRPYNSSINYNITGTTGLNNDTANFAKVAIVGQNYDNSGMINLNHGNVTGSMLFDPTVEHVGKTSYSDVDFEFIYNKNTGYYEYRSSLNHAQFNSTTNRIELYADTLAPSEAINYIPSRIDLSSYLTDAHVDVNSVSTNNATGQLIGTGRDIDEDGNVTPQIYYPISFPSIDVKQISFDVYLPQVKEPNAFKICFTTDDENVVDHGVYNDEKCFKLEYDGQAVNDTYYLVADTFSNELWSGNITGLMISPYEIYNTTNSFDFRMDDISFLSNDGYSTSYAGFYPFAQIENSIEGDGETFNISNWESAMNNEPNSEIFSSRMIDDSLLDVKGEFLRFGYVTTIDFFMNRNKTVTGSSDDASTIEDNLRFEFSGDDDLWVFIDGKLVLDVGGGHGIIDGYIDFTQNKTYVSKAVRVNGYNSMEDINSAREQQGNIDQSILSEGKHTMQIFHVERTGNYSNSMIRFNLPQNPAGDVIVSKQAVDENGNIIDTNADFEFTIEADGNLLNGVQYSIFGEGITNTETRQVSNGTFTLKNNQYAIFSMEPNREVKITEARTEIPNWEYTKTTINDEETNTLTQTKLNGSSLEYNVVNIYNNAYVEERRDVTVSKKAVYENGTNIETNADFEFTIAVDGNLANGLEYIVYGDGINNTETRQVSNGTFTLKNNQYAVFNLLTNSEVRITETGSNIPDLEYISTMLNGQNTNTLTQTINNNNLEFNFINSYREIYVEERRDVTVSKKAVDVNGNIIDTNADFGFTIEVNGNLANGLEYYVYGEGITNPETRYVSNGTFTLKNNQYAVFNLLTNSEVRITETGLNIPDFEYISTTVNGQNTNTLTQTIINSTDLEFKFINSYRENYVEERRDVTVYKMAINENWSNIETNADFEFTIEVNGNLANGLEYIVYGEGITNTETRYVSNGTFTLKKNQYAVFNLLTNSEVRITETGFNIPDFEYISTMVNGQNNNSLTQTINNNNLEFNFINTYREIYVEERRDVTISKRAVDVNGNIIDTNADFGFTIAVDGNLVNGLEYIVYGEGITNPETRQVSNGTFTLKNNQYAVFNLLTNSEVRITETGFNIPDFEYISTTVNDQTTNSLTQTIINSTDLEFKFVNSYRENYVEERRDVTVSKMAIYENWSNIETNADFEFTIEVNGNLANELEYIVYGEGINNAETRQVSNGTFTLKNNQYAVFNLLTNSEVRITETGSNIPDLEYVSTMLNGQTTNTLTQTINNNNLEFNFINIYKENYVEERRDVTVSKMAIYENWSNIGTNADFEFTIEVNGNLTNELEYMVYGEGINNTETRQVSNGTFTLKKNQYAVFNLLTNSEVRITETGSNIPDLEYVSTMLNGQTTNTLTQTINNNNIEFNFINIYKENYVEERRDVTVSKRAIYENWSNIDTNADFEFTIEVNGNLANGLEYIVSGEGINNTETRQVSNGTFTLKNNQYAVFNLLNNSEVKITETGLNIPNFEYISTMLNGQTTNTLTQTINNNNIEFNFINSYKDVTSEEPDPDFTPYTINYFAKIDPSYDKWHQGTVRLNNAYVATDYVSERIDSSNTSVIGAIAESNGDTLIFNGWYTDQDCKDLLTRENVLIPSNLSSDTSYYACFIPKVEVATLIIKTVTPGEQTFLYKIESTDNTKNKIDLVVASVNGEPLTITNLPVGNYKVTEITNWNNKYSIEQWGNPDYYIYLNVDEQREITYTNNTLTDIWVTAGTYASNFYGING